MSYHPPGVAAVRMARMLIISMSMENPYTRNEFLKTFGYYELMAAVQDDTGYYHIDINGNPLYKERYSWAGNFQEGLCVVRDSEEKLFPYTLTTDDLHITNDMHTLAITNMVYHAFIPQMVYLPI